MKRASVLSALVIAVFFLVPSWTSADGCDSTALERLRNGNEQAVELERLAEKLAEGCPDDVEVQLACGAVFEANDRFDLADEAYRRAAALAPDSAVPWARRARVARLQGDLETWELYLDSARALEADDTDGQEIMLASEEPVDDSETDAYSFKDADQITDGLRVGSKSIRPKSISGNVDDDYFVGSKGFGVNLGILFEVAETSLKQEGRRQVEQLGRAFERAAPSEKYLIEGHSSSEGDPGFNDRLSVKRAEAIADVLVREFGVDPRQIEFVGRGTEFPILEGGVENRSKSRRVTVLRLYDE